LRGQTTIQRCGASTMHPPEQLNVSDLLPFEVTTLDVATPLALALNGDTAILVTAMVIELSPMVSCSCACH
jgi:hypothetical protein